jgi:glycosyltransferase involved in cell wall biosynthesis
MKILMLSWEYPPKNVGGLSNHVYYLSQALSKRHEIHVIHVRRVQLRHRKMIMEFLYIGSLLIK